MNKIEGISFPDFDYSNLKILTPKQILQRIPVVLVQVKADKTSENFISEIRLCIEQNKFLKE